MKWTWNGWKKLPALLERFKYPVLILLLGVALLLWPSKKQTPNDPAAPESALPEATEDQGQRYREAMERELEGLLSQISGAGKVRVMLTLKTGAEQRYQVDRVQTENREGDRVSSSLEEKTVMADRGSAYNEPAVASRIYPVFQGALIVAEGGGDAEVRYQLSAAVAALLDLGADQITVLKMK